MNRYQHPSERGFDFEPPAASRLAASRRIEESQRCYCFSQSKASTATTDERVAATDQANVQQADVRGSNVTGGSTVAGGDLVNLNLANAKIGDDNRTDNTVTGSTVAGGDVLTTSLDLAAAKIGNTEIGNIAIEDSSPEVLAAALEKVSEFAALSEASRQKATEGLFNFAKLSEQGRAEVEAASSEKLSELLTAQAEATQKTDKDTQTNRTVLFIVLGGLVFLLFRKT